MFIVKVREREREMLKIDYENTQFNQTNRMYFVVITTDFNLLNGTT